MLDREDTLPLLRNAGRPTLARSLDNEGDRLESQFSLVRQNERTLFFVRRASIWSLRTLVRDFSAFALWMYSINTRLFLKTLPFDFW